MMETSSLARAAFAASSHSSVRRRWYSMLTSASPLTVVRKLT